MAAITLILVLTLSFVMSCGRQGITGAAVKQDKQTQPIQQEDEFRVMCSKDSECGQTVRRESYCFQNNAVTPVIKPTCNNPGSIKSECRNITEDEVELCIGSGEACRHSRCVTVKDEPCTDSDSGKDYTMAGKVYDADLMEYKDYCTNDDTLVEYYCVDNKGFKQADYHTCEDGKCVSGECRKYADVYKN